MSRLESWGVRDNGRQQQIALLAEQEVQVVAKDGAKRSKESSSKGRPPKKSMADGESDWRELCGIRV